MPGEGDVKDKRMPPEARERENKTAAVAVPKVGKLNLVHFSNE